MLPLRARVDHGVMVKKVYSTFPKAPPSDCLVSYPGHSLRESNVAAEVQSVYSAAPTDRAPFMICSKTKLFPEVDFIEIILKK